MNAAATPRRVAAAFVALAVLASCASPAPADPATGVAFIVVLRCPKAACDSVFGAKSWCKVTRVPDLFTADAARHALAQLARVPDSLIAVVSGGGSYGGPAAEQRVVANGDGLAFRLGSDESATFAIGRLARGQVVGDVATPTLEPDEVALARVSLGGTPCVFVLSSLADDTHLDYARDAFSASLGTLERTPLAMRAGPTSRAVEARLLDALAGAAGKTPNR